MANTSIILTPELDGFVNNLVKTGMYGNKSEVIREALRLLHQQREEAKLNILKAALAEGLESGDGGEWNPKKESLSNFAKGRK
jgi:antitoxin ParD1/3/4